MDRDEKIRRIVRECMEYNPRDVEFVQDTLVQNGIVFSLSETRRLMHIFDPLNLTTEDARSSASGSQQ